MNTAPAPTPKQYESIRLFKSPLLEALTHVHPSIPFVLWIPAILYFIYFSAGMFSLPIGVIALFFAAGLLFWTLTEYGMHRYVFHFHATTRFGKYLVFLFHGIHHDDPQDPTRLVMPPIISLTLGPAFYLLFRLVLGAPHALPFFSGFMSGYLVYDYIHFATHHFGPRTKWGKTLKENHMKHHFLAKKGKWGVSSPLWDHIFGTYKQ
jgi:sterol desaturase/sphingolipid hydroxylase (fatty acid hydroxylase superfamily)